MELASLAFVERHLVGAEAVARKPRHLRMHGSAWRGDGATLLRALADILTK